MKLDSLLELVGGLPWFDLATLVQLTDERRATLVNQLHRFSRAGKVVPLRRGMYVLAERYRRVAVNPAELAGAIYRPSYLSRVWALSYHGVIPEKVAVYTSVTTRSPARFTNAFGEYEYRNVKRAMFGGYQAATIDGRRVLIASPEKALLDHWHLEPGEWTEDRMRQLRLDPSGGVDPAALEAMAREAKKPRLTRAFVAWARVTVEATDGEVEL